MGSRNNKPGRIVKGTALQPSLKDASGIWSLDEAMQAHRVNAWPQPNLFQPVSNSLRLKNASSTSLARQASRPGNQRTWTWSAWVKRGLVDLNYRSLFANGSASDYILFWNDNSLAVSNFNATDYIVRTTQLFRDPSAWYHLVIAMDTTQATSSNRIKIYVNGVQVTSFAVSTYPSQNYTTKFNASTVQYLGYNEYNHFDGQIGEVNFIDGYQLDPSLLGKFDTNNTWVPVPYTGSYGTNGFYLPFTNATTSQTLGYDASLTGTATYDVDQDPYRGSVALHLTGNGPAGGNNNVFADSSSNNLAITRGGTATQGSFSPFPFNTTAPYNPSVHGASAYFNGSSDYLTVGSFPAIGTQDFTVECWVYANSTATTGGYNPRTFDLVGIQLVIEDSGGRICRLDFNDANSLYTTGSGVFQINQWNHIAVVRISNIVSFYLNGVAQTGGTRSDNLTGGTGYIGVYKGGTLGFWNGYISGFRATIGKGIYTAAFTPTMRPFGTLTNNIVVHSDDLANTNYWSNPSSFVIANSIIAPDGTPTGAKLVGTNTSGVGISKTMPVTSGLTYTWSFHAKAGEQTSFQLQLPVASFSSGTDRISSFNLITGTATNSGVITNVGNGWWRCSITATAIATTATASIQSYIVSPTGNGVDGLYIWGPQFEQASSVTTYTPTPANYSTAPSLLLNFANAAVTDSAGAQNLIASGSPTITSSAKYGSGAMTFNGSGDYWITPATPSLAFGTDNFTIEGWINNFALNNMPVLSIGTYVTGIDIRFNESGSNQFGLYINSVWVYGTFTTTNQWRHFAITRQNTTVRIFIDGQQIATTSNNTNLTGNYAWIGKFTAGGVGGNTSFYGSMDDLRITKGVARYQDSFTPPARALPETGGKSFVTVNVNAGVVKTFTLDNLNIVSAKIYHVTTAQRSANYTVQYSDDNSTWTTAFGGVMSSMDGTVGIKVGTVTSGGSGTTGTGAWGPHLYWRYVEGSTVSGHHPRCSRIIFTDSTGRDFNFRVFAVDNSSDIGDYQIGTRSGVAQGPTLNTSWTAPVDVTSVEVLVVAGGGGGGGKNTGGGGGGGGLIYNNAYPVTPGQTYTVTVGVVGTNAAGYQSYGGNGGNSVFGNLTAIGGGGGGYGVQGGTRAVAGKLGGSGGGGGGDDTGGPFTGGAGTAGQGFTGGQGTSPGANAGGGGGAGAPGGDSVVSTRGGNGAAGLAFGISGLPTSYAGGGGGGGNSTAGTGGTGGGGAGAAGNPPATATSGTPHTGGGGGGCGGYETGFTAGTGGSGVVIVRYTTQAVSNSSDATSDNLVDSPTQYGHDTGAGGEVVGNYATWNPLDKSPTAVLSGGNLDITPGFSTQTITRATMSIPLGQWYFEVTCRSTAGDASAGEIGFNTAAARAIDGGYATWAANSIYYTSTSGNKNIFGTSTSYGATWTANDIIGVAIDTVAGTIVFYKNGASQGTITNGLITPNTLFPVFANNSTSGSRNVSANFGQRAWAYAPPVGYNALTTKNLPRLAIGSAAATPNQYFDTVLYTGNSSTQTISSLNFQPDLVWLKSRSNAGTWNNLVDSVRGASKTLYSNTTNAEGTDNYLSSFNSNGFTLNTGDTGTNTSTYTYVAWCWRAGGAAVANTAGTITSSVSANTTSGFSVVTYTGNGTAGATVGHGLGAAPNLVIWKKRSSTSNWFVWSKAMDVLTGSTGWLYLNTTNAQQTSGSTNEYPTYKIDPTSTLITLNGTGSSNGDNDSSATYVAYCWTEIPGFSKFGSWTNNNSNDGTFVYLGFKPAFVMLKNTDNVETWYIIDAKRPGYNVAAGSGSFLVPNSSGAEGVGNAGTATVDFVSNGFKIRTSNPASGEISFGTRNYIYMAFAEKPFGNVNGVAR